MFWSCPKLEGFWRDIFKSFSDIYGVSIDPDPLLAVFGSSPEDTVLTESKRLYYTVGKTFNSLPLEKKLSPQHIIDALEYSGMFMFLFVAIIIIIHLFFPVNRNAYK